MIPRHEIKMLIKLGVSFAKTNASVNETVVGKWVAFDDASIEKEIDFFVDNLELDYDTD